MKYRVNGHEMLQRVEIEVGDLPDVEKDGVRVSPRVVVIKWEWDGKRHAEISEDGLQVPGVEMKVFGPVRDENGELLVDQQSLTFVWGEEDFPQGELSKFIEEHGIWSTGRLIPMALRWEEA